MVARGGEPEGEKLRRWGLSDSGGATADDKVQGVTVRKGGQVGVEKVQGMKSPRCSDVRWATGPLLGQ